MAHDTTVKEIIKKAKVVYETSNGKQYAGEGEAKINENIDLLEVGLRHESELSFSQVSTIMAMLRNSRTCEMVVVWALEHDKIFNDHLGEFTK